MQLKRNPKRCQFYFKVLDRRQPISVTTGYMVERDGIQHGTRLRLLRQRDGVAFGTVGRVDTVRAENWGTAWGFSLYWEDHRQKNRYSLFFSEADLAYFELLSASPRPMIDRIRPIKSLPTQLLLPFSEVALYRGTEVVGTFEMSID